MFKKSVFWLGLFFCLIVFPLSFKPTNSISDDLSSSYSPTKGIVQFSSHQPIKLKTVSSVSGNGQITIYKSNIDEVIKYLIHDKDYKQINPKIDLSGKDIVLTLDNIKFYSSNHSESADIIEIPLNEPAGIWIVQTKVGDKTEFAFIIRNTFGSVAKDSKDNIIVWSQSFSDKRTLKQGLVKLYNLESSAKVIGSSSIGGDGVASLPLSVEADIAIVDANGEIALVPLNEKRINSYFWSSYATNNPQNKYFPFTDRPIYKPGDTVNFKAIIRSDDDARYSIPSGPVNIKAYTGYGDNEVVVFRQTLTIDSYGNVFGQFRLPEDAPTGYYTLEVMDNSRKKYWGPMYYNYYNRHSVDFKVENYRKPESLLTSSTSQTELIRGDQINIDINGQLFSGQPLPDINVNYKIRSSNHSSEYYSPLSNDYQAWYNEIIDEGSLSLNSKGIGKLIIPTNKYASIGQDQIFSVEITYVDPAGNTAVTGNNFYIHSGEFSIYRTDENNYLSGQINKESLIPLTLKRNNQSNFSLAKTGKVKIEREWSEKIEVDGQKYPRYESRSEILSETNINFDSSGNSKVTFVPPQAGQYIFTVETKDSRNNLVSNNFHLWVDVYQNNNYSYDSKSSISFTLDKKSYFPGDTAVVNITSSVPDRDVFLSIDRGYMDRYQIVNLNGPQASINIPLTDHDMPNIYVSTSTFDADKFDQNSINVPVSPQKMKLNISVVADKTKYGPGEEVVVNIATTDMGGNPTSANLALWAVDKSIFELSDKNYGDIFESFWTERFNNTVTSHSLQGVFATDGAEGGGCFLPDTLITLADGSYKKISDIKVGDKILTKKNFASSTLVTDTVKQVNINDEASYLIINHKLKLTTDHVINLNGDWHTAGSAQIGDFLTNQQSKPIKIYSIEWIKNATKVYNLSLKQHHTFFADNFWVHNDKGESRINFTDIAYWNPSINTNSNGQAQIRFKLPDNLTTWKIVSLGSSLDTKLGETYTDIKVSKDLVIRPVLPNLLRRGDSFDLSAIVHNFTDFDKNLTVSLKSPDVDLTSSPQTINLKANSFTQVYWPAKTLTAKNGAILNYSVKEANGLEDIVVQNIDILPQGYWSQSYSSTKGSSSIDVSIPSNLDRQLSSLKLDFSPSLLGSLVPSMDYLIDYPYGCVEQTTSRLVPLIVAKTNEKIFSKALQGRDINKMTKDGINRLRDLQNYDGGWAWWRGDSDPFVTAYVAKILSQLKQIGVEVPDNIIKKTVTYLKNIESQNRVLSNYGLSYLSPGDLKPINQDLNSLSDDYLALAVHTNLRLGDNNSSTNGLDLLISRAKQEGQTLYWQPGSIVNFGSIEASTALAAQALTLAKSDLSTQAIMYLNNHRDRGYLANSFATAQVVESIVNYSVKHQDVTPNYSYTVKVDDQKIASGNITDINSNIPSLSLDLNKYQHPKRITIEKNGAGEIYTNLNSKLWILDTNAPKVSNMVNITRNYFNVKGREYNIVPGDLVRVVLDVSFDENTSHNYGIIEDYLPSGLIPVNTNLDNESVHSNQRSWMINTQFTKDGVIIPFHNQSRDYTYTYLARAINSGDFTAPPASVSLMYNPSVFGRTSFDRLKIDTQVKKSRTPYNSKTSQVNKPNLATVLTSLVIGLFLVKILNKKIIPYVKNKTNLHRPNK